jgi:two-component system, OmpR family, phosphate regulon response regulator OmpR
MLRGAATLKRASGAQAAPMASTRLLLIEDDAALAGMVAEYLGRAGFSVDHRAGAKTGLASARAGAYAAVILDLMLPDGDGLDLCRALRAVSDVPILMLTARGDESDRILGLELGADDYLPKPFNPRELLARIRAILRRRNPAGVSRLLRFGRLAIDRDARTVTLDGAERTLTAYQFDLLVALAEAAGRVLSRDQLMDRLKGHELEAFDRSIDVHVSRIRAAIEDDPKAPRRVLTVRGAGYVFARRQDEDG